MKQSMEEKREVAVSILCVTYNHKDFIAKALDGFLMQKTNFPYEIVVHDDVSTDGTREILLQYQEKYPDKIRLILQEENQFSKGIRILPTFLIPAIRGKYAAYSDGDDEWTYDGKLQAQYDFMEEHPEVSMCMHNAIQRNHINGEQKLEVNGRKEGFLTDGEVIQLKEGYPPTTSWFYRSKYVLNYPSYNFHAPVGDVPLLYHMGYMGKIYYMDKVWAVRNFMHEGSWNYRYEENAAFQLTHTKKMLKYLYQFNKFTNRRFAEYICKSNRFLCEKAIDIKFNEPYTCQILRSCIQDFDVEMDYIVSTELREVYVVKERECIDYVEEVLSKFVEKCEDVKGKLYIYGAGLEAKKYVEILKKNKILFDGFVVSDGHRKQDKYLEYNVYELKEISNFSKKNYFLFALNISNRMEAVQKLGEKGYHNYI